jgi:hypothetical protein
MGIEVAKGIVRLPPSTTPAAELAFQPRALILWWCRDPVAGCAGGIGFATDGGGEASTAWAADDALAPGVLSRWGAETPLLFHKDPRAPEASYRGHIRFAKRGFAIDCDCEPADRWLIHYLALGGSDVHAAVRNLVLDCTGTYVVSGIGFTPGSVLAATGAGSTPAGPQSDLAVGFGAATGRTRQAAGGFVARVDAGQTVARGAQCSDAIAVLPVAAPSAGIGTHSRLFSLDRDGFTLETTQLSSELSLAVLALGGGDSTAGLDAASSRATRLGFDPTGALLFGTGLTATAHARDIGRLCLGGFSRDQSAGCVTWSVRARGAWPLDPRSRSTTEAAFEITDTTSSELHARAILSSLGRRRFSLSWPVRDRYPRDYGFAAFGPEVRKPRLRDRLRGLRGGSLRE